MSCRNLWIVACLTLATASPVAAQTAVKETPKAAADSLDGPPFVSAKAWVIADGKTGKVLWGSNEADVRPTASTTKIMTAWVVLRLAAENVKVLDETVEFSDNAAKTTGSSAKLLAGDRLPVRELLYGLLLPSGNDAAVALAEHFGGRLGKASDGDSAGRFVAEMNRQAKELGLKETSYKDPHGLNKDNVSSARDLASLARTAMTDERFRAYVATRNHDGSVVGRGGEKRLVSWTNTNKLLDVEGYEGVKTGTTTPAGNCLVAAAKRGDDRLIVVVLGSTATDGRYVDARNLFRWGWHERKAEAGKNR